MKSAHEARLISQADEGVVKEEKALHAKCEMSRVKDGDKPLFRGRGRGYSRCRGRGREEEEELTINNTMVIRRHTRVIYNAICLKRLDT